jgi:hypothetical protein
LGFWQAVLISLCTTATLDGQDAPARNTVMISTVTPAASTASPIVTLCLRANPPRRTLRRP